MLRKIIAALSIGAILMAGAQAQQPAPLGEHSVLVRGGQGLKFVTLQPLSTATAKPGDDVTLRLTEPLVWGSLTLIPEGTTVHATVEKVKHPRRGCTNGELKLKLEQLVLAGGTRVASKIAFTNPDSNYKVPAQLSDEHISPWVWTLGSPILAVVGAIGGPYILGDSLIRRCSGLGNDYVLPANSTVAVQITKDYHVRYCTSADAEISKCP